jgi:biopolymer transport protein TolQ
LPALLLAPALLQIRILELFNPQKPVELAVFLFLLAFSLVSWTVIFAKWQTPRKARAADLTFLRVFRKAAGLQALALAAEQFKDAPLAYVFGLGYEEVDRQVKTLGHLRNKLAIERNLQVAISQETSRLEHSMNMLATAATVAPFVGLLGTVWGIIDAFNALSSAGAASIRAVGPGISNALVATGLGLFAAIPAAIFYNYFGNTIKQIGARMDEFSLEFMNLAERTFEE